MLMQIRKGIKYEKKLKKNYVNANKIRNKI